jgi:hypothetical protein
MICDINDVESDFFFHQFSRRGKEIFKKNQFDSLVLVYSGIFPNSSWYSALRQSWQHCLALVAL